MRLLVSLCSSTPGAPEALVVYDAASGRVDPVPLPDSGAGAFGLCLANDTIYCLIDHGRPDPEEPERSELCALDSSTLEVRWRYPFRAGRDVHSVAAQAGRIFVTSAGTDEVLELPLDDRGHAGGERVLWRPDPSAEPADHHHVNDIVIDGDEPRSSIDSAPWVRTRALSRRWAHSGSERAASVDPRRKPRSWTTPRITARTIRVCAICRLDTPTLQIQEVIPLELHGREVYDIVMLHSD